jgi:hypothetical protein
MWYERETRKENEYKKKMNHKKIYRIYFLHTRHRIRHVYLI